MRHFRDARDLAPATWLAYYTVLSLAPLLVLTLAVIGIFLRRGTYARLRAAAWFALRGEGMRNSRADAGNTVRPTGAANRLTGAADKLRKGYN